MMSNKINDRDRLAVREVNKQLAKRVLQVVDAGLALGKGKPIPGQMCVEAAVCYAMGQRHSDKPTCVHDAVRAGKIALNDMSWSSNEARAKGMRRLAVAQLGSLGIDRSQFINAFAFGILNLVLYDAIKEAQEQEQSYLPTLQRINQRTRIQDWTGLVDKEELDEMNYFIRPYARVVSCIITAMQECDGNAECLVDSIDFWAQEAKTEQAIDERLTLIADCMEEALRKCKSPGVKWLSLCE